MGVIVKNAAILMGSQAATWAVSLVTFFLVPRYLGSAQFGHLAFAGAFVSFFGLLAGLGGGQFMVKEVARDPSRLGSYVVNALMMNALLVEVLSLAAIVSASLLGYPTQTVLLVAIASMGLLLGTLNGILVSALQGQQRMGLATLWSTITIYASSLGTIWVVTSHKGLIAVALVGLPFSLIPLVANGLRLRRQLLQGGAYLDLRLWRVLARGGAPFLVWGAVLTIYGSIDTPLLSFLAGDVTVAWYAIAYKLISVPAFLAPLVMTALFPALSVHGTGTGDFPRFARLTNQALRMVAFLTVPMAGGLILVAPDVIRLLHYSNDFRHAIPLIQILAVHVPVVGIDTILGAALIACDRQRQWVIVGCIAAVLNPLVNLAAIPYTLHAFGNGAIGAAVVTVATEVLMMGGALYLRPRGIFDLSIVGFVLRCVLACGVMLAIIALGGVVWLPAKVALGIAIYAIASLALRTVSVRDIYQRTGQILASARLRSASSVS